MKKLLLILLTIFSYQLLLEAQIASPPSGSGTSTDPYIISNAENLYWITQNSSSWSSYFSQSDDIDISASFSWDGGKGFLPIGNTTTPFSGNYNGNNRSITGLTISRTSTDYIGMFGAVSGATIKNLQLDSVNISGNFYVGSIHGAVYGFSQTNVTNCSSSGTVSGNIRVGGLIGQSNGNISECSSSATVSANKTAGGLIGEIYGGSVSLSFATGDVTAGQLSSTDGYVGGLIGSNGGIISQCYATGDVSANFDTDYAGGLVSFSSTGSISMCYATGNVGGRDAIGSFIGFNLSTNISDCYALGSSSGRDYIAGFAGINQSSGTLQNCYSAGTVSATSTQGGFTSLEQYGASTTNSFWDINSSGQSTSASGIGKTTSEMKTSSTFINAGWDFIDTWQMIGENYPDLKTNSRFPIPGIPSLLLPENASEISDTTSDIIFVWKNVELADDYSLQISNSTDFSEIIHQENNLSDTTFTLANVLSPGDYYWRVKAKNQFGSGDWSSFSSFTITSSLSLPATPTLLYPADNTEIFDTTTTISFEWSRINDAFYYVLEISNSNQFDSILIQQDFNVDTTFILITSLSIGEYFWRVKAVNSVGSGDWSNYFKFIIKSSVTIPEPPILLYPQNFSEIPDTTNSITFVWSSVTNASNYSFEISSKENFDTLIHSEYNMTDTTYVLNSSDLPSNLYWRVNSSNSAGTSDWAEYFTISILTGIERNTNHPNTFALKQNYPNPFNPSTTIAFGLPENANVRLTVFNVVGERIAELYSGELSAGYHSIVWNGRNQANNVVPSGIYFYRMEAIGANGFKNFYDTKKMILLK